MENEESIVKKGCQRIEYEEQMENEESIVKKKRVLIIKCNHSGISGDLLVGALAELISIQKMQEFLDKIPHYITEISELSIMLHSKKDHGISGTQLLINQFEGKKEYHFHLDSSVIKTAPSSETKSKLSLSHEPQHVHSVITPQWIIDKLKAIAEGEKFSPGAKNYLEKCFQIIINAEASVHDISLDKIHLHEIGAVDTVIDLAGVAYGFQELGVFSNPNTYQVFAEPIAVGSGEVKIAHGIVPVPAPATLHILSQFGLRFIYGPESYELATPTGVALLAGLKELNLFTQDLSHLSKCHVVQQIGTGAGTLKLKDRANILQILFTSSSYHFD
ncbi:MAG: hypothetical protein DRO88_07620, partial [Promethearchaeia archaeon]